MREIIPNVLWIGNAFDARNIKAVMDAGFQVVVDLAIEDTLTWEKTVGDNDE